jgi:hypothetical protein
MNMHCITVSIQTAKYLQSCDSVHVDEIELSCFHLTAIFMKQVKAAVSLRDCVHELSHETQMVVLQIIALCSLF